MDGWLIPFFGMGAAVPELPVGLHNHPESMLAAMGGCL